MAWNGLVSDSVTELLGSPEVYDSGALDSILCARSISHGYIVQEQVSRDGWSRVPLQQDISEISASRPTHIIPLKHRPDNMYGLPTRNCVRWRDAFGVLHVM